MIYVLLVVQRTEAGIVIYPRLRFYLVLGHFILAVVLLSSV